MARPTKEFIDAWRALSGLSGTSGWRTFPVAPAGACELRAGRHAPGDEEALLASFTAATIPPPTMLPRGQGFSVDRIEQAGAVQGWLALSRQSSGSQELFAMMVADVAGVMDANAARSEEELLRAFLARVRGWQEFMKSGFQALAPEAETGLVGELMFLRAVIASGVHATFAVDAWVGPLDAPQDFVLGTGAIEVKSTLAAAGFRAKIGSLEQLDDSFRTPIFMAATRLRESQNGLTLPEIAAEIKNQVAHDLSASNTLTDRLLAAGYIDAHADRYTRRFALADLRIFEVTAGFPRITTGSAPTGILRATYEIDLEHAPGPPIMLIDTMRKLGVQ
ncbi:PD-(D/E)XK motif protein [Paraburkholderia sp. GAS82]|uniref:PD-(D/E)XK motif protein n=1 Tax=Paraburkholderia sp. GAS82 TaxID=3035137 RepID=UPI003D21FB4D